MVYFIQEFNDLFWFTVLLKVDPDILRWLILFSVPIYQLNLFKIEC